MPLNDVVGQRMVSVIYALASNKTAFKPDYVIKIGAIWFLNALFWGKCLLNFLLKINKRLVQILVILMALVATFFITNHYCLPLGMNYVATFVAWLYFGYQIKETQLLLYIKDNSWIKVVSLFFWFIIIGLEYVTNSSFNIIYMSYPLFGIEIIGAVLGSYSMYNLSKMINKYSKRIRPILLLIGSNTIWVLCFHSIDIELWKYVSAFIPFKGIATSVIRLIIDVSFAFLASSLFDKGRKSLQFK